MKLLSNIVVVSLLATAAAAYSEKSYGADFAQNLCGYVESDNKSRLRDQLKSNKIRLKKIYTKITCNGDSLLRFAMKQGSEKTGVFIVKRISAKILKANENDGQTIFQWAQANAQADSKIGQAIKSRAKL